MQINSNSIEKEMKKTNGKEAFETKPIPGGLVARVNQTKMEMCEWTEKWLLVKLVGWLFGFGLFVLVSTYVQ